MLPSASSLDGVLSQATGRPHGDGQHLPRAGEEECEEGVNGVSFFPPFIILALRDPPRPGPAHPRENGDSAARKSLDPKQEGLGLGFRV